ncbi:hypothetical protein HZH68_014418 [Vespula germanica]|uniref:Uncharacterized protein n=1 Tax=Vespula germanica TaxID=30212 RepID=A0A834JBZ2_VESGE|nr:hypothetical protein HZH68_014418 [Vespula germanica]
MGLLAHTRVLKQRIDQPASTVVTIGATAAIEAADDVIAPASSILRVLVLIVLAVFSMTLSFSEEKETESFSEKMNNNWSSHKSFRRITFARNENTTFRKIDKFIVRH